MARTITLDHITKIEGHASLTVKVDKGKVKKCELGSTEGARFFEGLVVGRPYDDAYEMVMRICGICSVGHFTASLKALENAMGVKVSKQTQAMREVMAIGERLRSHATHLYFLALPDYLGYESALAMAPKFKKEIADALILMKAGNDLVTVFGGRQMHPMGGRVGGFTHYPRKEQLESLISLLDNCEKPAMNTLKLICTLTYPDLWVEREHLSLLQEHGFPLLTGDIISDEGWRIKERAYGKYFKEYVDRWSTAKFVVKNGKSFMLGALPRINNNHPSLDADIKAELKKAKIHFPNKNPFYNNVAQAIELVVWVRRCKKLLGRYVEKGFKHEKIKVVPKAGMGVGVVEVPRGVLFHTYTINKKGYVTKCNIMTPTCQNLKAMQEDVKIYLQQLLDKGVKKADIPLEIEKLIRAYDPCFSCSTHFLKVEWE
ncbi:Ni/Fe hydrogenase subunit alpha [Candidatus Woesearchaeota archaeon]|nr:Ni/Fe hydrogenase subunit alpha [Candidatus Woesearchaeota archaeon]